PGRPARGPRAPPAAPRPRSRAAAGAPAPPPRPGPRPGGWLAPRQGGATPPRTPASLRLRYAPLSVAHHGQLLDLRRAVPAAPHDAYTAAIRGALADTPRLLLEDGEPGPGLPELRALVAGRYTSQGLPTLPEQILVTAGARAALYLLTAHFR